MMSDMDSTKIKLGVNVSFCHLFSIVTSSR